MSTASSCLGIWYHSSSHDFSIFIIVYVWLVKIFGLGRLFSSEFTLSHFRVCCTHYLVLLSMSSTRKWKEKKMAWTCFFNVFRWAIISHISVTVLFSFGKSFRGTGCWSNLQVRFFDNSLHELKFKYWKFSVWLMQVEA